MNTNDAAHCAIMDQSEAFTSLSDDFKNDWIARVYELLDESDLDHISAELREQVEYNICRNAGHIEDGQVLLGGEL